MGIFSSFFKPKCPNCKNIIPAKPKRKWKCPHCGSFIFIRQGKMVSEKTASAILEREESEIRQSILDSQRRGKKELNEMADIFPYVQIQGLAVGGHICKACERHNGRVYSSRNAQLPPFNGCSCVGGCRCGSILLLQNQVAKNADGSLERIE